MVSKYTTVSDSTCYTPSINDGIGFVIGRTRNYKLFDCSHIISKKENVAYNILNNII